MSLDSELKEAVRAAVLEVLREQGPRALPISPNQLPEPLALPVDEVARLTGVKPRTVREWIRDGDLRASRPGRGRNYLVLRCDVLEFLSRTGPGPRLHGRPVPVPSPSTEVARILSSLPHSSR